MQGVTLVAFFKGTAGQFNNLPPRFACKLMARAADIRSTVSPLRMIDCKRCEGSDALIVANGPHDFDKEECADCNGTGKVVSNN
jgi:DnaJ-class molecular chaperone